MMNDEANTSPLDFSILSLPYKSGEWADADGRMFHACFVILGQYVENELGSDHDEGTMYRGYRLHSADILEDDPSGMPAASSSDRKAIDLWLWYRDELPFLEADYDRDVSECFSGKMQTVEETVNGVVMHRVVSFGKIREPAYPHDWPETVMDEKLRDLIDLRRSLWT